jgi:hypothetical protein
MADPMTSVTIQATQIIVPVVIVLGATSNSLNIYILTRPALIHHACSLYFLALAITNLFYSTVILVNNLLADGYYLNLSLYSTFFCKFISYLLNLCPNLSVYLIVLASIDRYCASSISAQKRKFSSVHIARWAIGLLTLVLAFFFSGALIAFDIDRHNTHQCTILSGVRFNQVFLIIDLTMYVIIAPLCMLLFGLLTIHNTNGLRIYPTMVLRYRRTEGQLSRMLLLQVGTHIILTLPFCIVFLILILPVSFRFTLHFINIYTICKLPFYLSFTTAFFLYTLSARVYRKELVRLYKKIFRVRRVTNVHMISNVNGPLQTNAAFVNR